MVSLAEISSIFIPFTCKLWTSPSRLLPLRALKLKWHPSCSHFVSVPPSTNSPYSRNGQIIDDIEEGPLKNSLPLLLEAIHLRRYSVCPFLRKCKWNELMKTGGMWQRDEWQFYPTQCDIYCRRWTFPKYAVLSLGSVWIAQTVYHPQTANICNWIRELDRPLVHNADFPN